MVFEGIRARFGTGLEFDDIQAAIVRMRPEPYYGTHALIEIRDAADGRRVLRRLADRVTCAADMNKSGAVWTSLAITHSGLAALGVPAASLASFPENFRDGMAKRAAGLRDTGPNAPANWQQPFGSGRIHLAVSVYADSVAEWRSEVSAYEVRLQEVKGIAVLSRQDFGAQPDSVNAFGFKDGFTQPKVEGSGVAGSRGDGRAIKAGEFIFGYPSESGRILPMPAPDVLGRNGTFVVFRKYHSHVAAFNRFIHANARTEADRELLAAKIVGRWRSGAPLALAPHTDDPALGSNPDRNNDFTYGDDPQGLKTPLSSHIRRMNPRDTKLKVLSNVNIRRVIRRSTTYGLHMDKDVLVDDGRSRGLDYVALGVRAIDTLEFLQSEWINSGNFLGLGQEKDPLIGLQAKDATFTVPGVPPRYLRGIETYNTLLGGEYFFMPSIPAIRWIGNVE